MIVRTWDNGKRFPNELLKKFYIHDEDDAHDAFEEFREMVNEKLHKGDRITYMTHKWNFTLETPEGKEYQLYMYEEIL